MLSLVSDPLIPLILTLVIEDQVYADPIKKLQEEFYQQLIVLREGLYQTLDISCASAAAGPAKYSQTASSGAPISKEGADEVTKLRDENTKLQYRIGILVKSLDEQSSKWVYAVIIIRAFFTHYLVNILILKVLQYGNYFYCASINHNIVKRHHIHQDQGNGDKLGTSWPPQKRHKGDRFRGILWLTDYWLSVR